jgi:SAM-dependent methyltransferase
MMRRNGESRVPAAERVSLVPTSPWWGEHRSRYHFAGSIVAGRTVLDVACGTGFGGLILLKAGAEWVLGTDLSREGLDVARKAVMPRYHLFQADGTRLPLRDSCVGAITSFETLEHVPQYHQFIAELRRVLRPDGVLILSTPNALHTRPVDGKPRNPFHAREFTPGELHGLLDRPFGRVQLLGQRTHPRYRVSPYWELRERLPRDLAGRLRVLGWKAQARLPYALKNTASQVLHGHSFYPGEHDFVFTPEAVETGHVLVAICQP